MQERISELRESFAKALALATDGAALENLRVEYLGKKGCVADLMKGLRDVADKKAAGQLINEFKNEVEEKLSAATAELRAAEIAAKVRSAKK